MKPRTRLTGSLSVVVFSAIYGFLVVEAPQFAEAIAVGYIAALLTILAILHFWKDHS